MPAVPDNICPAGVLNDTRRAAPELLKAFLMRTNFIPGVRHRLGWRGVNACAHGLEAWTARVDGLPGVFGIHRQEVETSGPVSRVLLPLSYFPHPEEEPVEHFSVSAGIITQSGDYLPRVRNYLDHPDMRELFTLGMVRLAVHTKTHTCRLSLEAQQRSLVIAAQGVEVVKNGRTAMVVEPGGADQDLPAWDMALVFFRVLGATASFCMRQGPSRLAGYQRPGRALLYDEAGARFHPAPEPERMVRLCWGEDHWPEPDGELERRPWRMDPGLDWEHGQPHPEEFAHAPWWSADVPGERSSLDKTGLGIVDKPRLIILSGFLGAGKTSFLRHFIEYQAAQNQFVAVIQNEIGEQGLDGKLLGQQYAVTEVDEGCVCCSLVGSLRTAVHGIMRSFHPDVIVVETTGLANPANLLAEMDELEELVDFDTVATVVDCAEGMACLEQYEVARNQAATADVIVLNKTDLATGPQREALRARLRELNPKAPIVEARDGDAHPGLLFGVNLRREDLDKKAPRAPGHGHCHGHSHDHSHDHLAAVSLPVPEALCRQSFERALGTLPRSVFRLKGMVRFQGEEGLQVVQYVGGRCTLSPADSDARAAKSFLIAIGTDMDAFAAQNPFAGCRAS